MKPSLLTALLHPEPTAGAAWRQWRQALDSFERVTYPEQLLLPMLGSRLSQWTAGDPDAARFRGLVRQTWTRNQLQLQSASALQMSLAAADVPAALAGPAVYALRADARGAVRAIPHIDLVIAREQLDAAAVVLQREGYHADEPLPDVDALDWRCHIRLRKGPDMLYLHWRVYPAVFHQTRLAEHACFARLQTMVWNGQSLRVIGDADTLLHCVTGPRHDDQLPWEADVPLLPLDTMDWDGLRSHIRRFSLAPNQPHPLARLNAIRRAFPGLAIPAFTAAECVSRASQPLALWREYRNQCAHRNIPVGLRGFVAFLVGGAAREWQRWQRRPSWKS